VNASFVALTVISAIVFAGSFIGFYARRHHAMDLEQWTVGGRAFGVLLVWLLMAGEIYTSYTFLGASGWAYSRGAPVLYILGVQPLAYVVSFYILPQVWEAGRRYRLQTQADFFDARYGSTYLQASVALLGVIFLVPYLQLQLTGLGMILEVASFGGIHRTPGMAISCLLVAAFVFISGIRGVAWVSVLKDSLLLFAALFLGFAIPHIYFGGIGPMFAALARVKPGHLVMPGATKDLGHAWYVSTVLITSFGYFMWPHNFGSSFTAKSAQTLRRNAVIMPLYGVTMPLMLFIGFTAILVLPGLKNGDLSLLTLVRKTFPPWFLGIIGGAGALTAMVPAAIQILTAATLFIKNVYRPMLAPSMGERHIARLAKAMVLVITAIALYFAVYSSTTLVALLLLGYAGVAQFFPGVVLGLYSRRASAPGVFAGIVAGVAMTALLMLRNHDPFMGWNAGFIGLCLNFVICGAMMLLRPSEHSGFEKRVERVVAE
jgi:solute:Na+ symporter, SSS family